ncbi:MAG: ATP-binding protein [Cellvibrionaceae bacterium]|nr:ATP-binding protein [Cellvibrionaceae bacterium]MCV6625273.1 ATP-binding protein [Cellvibrionaceae bacterium]
MHTHNVLELGNQSAANPDVNPDLAKLQQAFSQFNELSAHLADSYQLLEGRVNELTEELNSVSQQRIQELAEKEQLAGRLETLLSVLPGGVVVLDDKGLIKQCNPAAKLLLGSNIDGRLWRELVEEVFAPRLDDGHEVSTKDGRFFSIATSSIDEGGQIILLTDQTPTRRLQAQLSRHERLSAIGKMVSALAHQIRTPLSTAMLYAGHLAKGGLKQEKVESYSQKLLGRLSHLEQQVQDMLLFAKGELPLNDTIELSDLYRGVLEAMEEPLHSSQSYCVNKPLAEGHARLRCNREALIGAILNLVNNAIDAAGGEAQLSLEFAMAAGQVEIKVCDQGPGLSEAELTKVQEVFYTTKSHGTGLGLAVVQSVSRAHGGEFSLASNSGSGCCASIVLPLLD